MSKPLINNTPAPISPTPCQEIVKGMKLDIPRRHMNQKKQTPVNPGDFNAANDDVIEESNRNNTLASMAGSMRRTGMSEQAIDAALQVANQERCQPPLDSKEVSAIAKSIAVYPAANPGNILETLTDTGNANRFANHWHRKVRYVPELKKWLIWNGCYWSVDNANKVVELAKEVARNIYLEGVNNPDPSVRDKIAAHSRRSQQKARLDAMISLAESIPFLVASVADLDQKHDLLCVANGVINLSNGTIQQAEPSDLITQCTSIKFNAEAKCPVFIKFLKHIMGGNMDLIAYVQKVFGYALTGRTDEQCLFFLYGHGANGKSTLLNILSEILGKDYAKQTPSETLMVRFGGRTTTNDLARLRGARVVISNEIEDGSHLAESMIKQVTGGDPISARFLYGEYFEFTPVFKLFIAGNHKPIIRNNDHGIWRRIMLIPFDVTITEGERDPQLLDKLKAELPGILNWALSGCSQWRSGGMTAPSIITNAVEEYRAEMDILGQWIDECTKQDSAASWAASDAYLSFKYWCDVNGFKSMSNAAFGRKLSERFKKERTATGNIYRGLCEKKEFRNI